MNARIMMVLTSRSCLHDESAPAGSWLEELAAPYYTFRAAGVEPVLASIGGGAAPIDPASLDDPWLTESGSRFRSDPEAMAAIASTPALSRAEGDVGGIFLVGGAAVMWDFPVDPALGALIAATHEAGKLVAAVCHGVGGLLNPGAPASLLRGRRLTCISDKEDELAGYDKLVPFMPEGRLRDAGAELSFAAEPFGCHALRDGHVVTGQNPASAARCAELAVEVLQAQAALSAG